MRKAINEAREQTWIVWVQEPYREHERPNENLEEMLKPEEFAELLNINTLPRCRSNQRGVERGGRDRIISRGGCPISISNAPPYSYPVLPDDLLASSGSPVLLLASRLPEQKQKLRRMCRLSRRTNSRFLEIIGRLGEPFEARNVELLYLPVINTIAI